MADDYTLLTPEPVSWWDHFIEEQKRLTKEYLLDPSNRTLVGIAIVGGVVSSLALGKLYGKLSVDPTDGTTKDLVGRSLGALAIGVGYVFWELNKAQYQSVEDAALATEFQASDLV